MTDLHAPEQAQRREVGYDQWINVEIADSSFKEAWLARRLRMVLGQRAKAGGHTMALVCQDWANSKAAYRYRAASNSSRQTSWLATFPALNQQHPTVSPSPILC